LAHGRHRWLTLTWAIPATVLALLVALSVIDPLSDDPPDIGQTSSSPIVGQDVSWPTTVDAGATNSPLAPAAESLDAAAVGAQRLGSLLRLHFVDGVGVPVAGAPLWLLSAGDERRLAEVDPLLTDGDGWAELGGLAPGVITVLGRLDLQASVDIPANTVVTRELVLDDPGEPVRGRVVSGSGEPIAGARVWCSQSPNTIELGGVVGMTDAAGGFEVAQVSAAHMLAADAEGYIPSFKVPIEFLREAPGAEVQIVLETGGFGLDMLVTDENDAPLSGVRIEAKESSYSFYVYDSPENNVTERLRRPVISDGHGRARLEGLAAHRSSLSIEARQTGRRLATANIFSFTPDGTPMTLAYPDSLVPLLGDSNVLELSLSPEAGFTGRVTNAQGEPVAQAVIKSLHFNSPYEVSTDADGRFALRQLSGSGDMDVPVTLTHPGYAPLRADLRLRTGKTTYWNPVLERGVDLAGTVVDSRGVPFAGAVLKAAADGWKNQVQTDASGGFHFGGIEGEQVTLSVFEDEQAQESWPSLELTVDVPAVGLVLELARGLVAGRVTGALVDTAGAPLQGEVSLKRDVSKFRRVNGIPQATAKVVRTATCSAGDGAFVVERVRAGRYVARIEVSGRPVRELPIDYLDVSVDHDLGTLVMPAGGTLTITPNIIAGESSDGLVKFILRTRSGAFVESLTIKVGAAKSFIQPAGRYLLFVVDSEMACRSVPVTLNEGERSGFVVDLQAAPVLWLQADKPELPFAEPVSVRVRDGLGELVKTFQWTGRSRLRSPMPLTPGLYGVSVGDDGPWTAFQAAADGQVVWLEP